MRWGGFDAAPRTSASRYHRQRSWVHIRRRPKSDAVASPWMPALFAIALKRLKLGG